VWRIITWRLNSIAALQKTLQKNQLTYYYNWTEHKANHWVTKNEQSACIMSQLEKWGKSKIIKTKRKYKELNSLRYKD